MSCTCSQAAHSQAAALARRRACASHALPLPFAGEFLRQRRAGVAAAAADDGGGVLAFLKGVQAGLPVIGLVSRLAAPGGGVEAGKLGYQEYTRACFERDTEESRAFGFAVAELSRTRKLVRAAQAARLHEARSRPRPVSLPPQNSRIMFVCWAVAQGAGVVAEDVVRLRAVYRSPQALSRARAAVSDQAGLRASEHQELRPGVRDLPLRGGVGRGSEAEGAAVAASAAAAARGALRARRRLPAQPAAPEGGRGARRGGGGLCERDSQRLVIRIS